MATKKNAPDAAEVASLAVNAPQNLTETVSDEKDQTAGSALDKESLKGSEENDPLEEDQEDDLAEATLMPDVDLSALSAEDRTTFGNLLRKINYRGPAVAKASKKAMGALLAESVQIHTRSGELTVTTDTKKLRQDMTELAASAGSGGRRCLRGIISGIREIDSNSNVKQYFAKVSFGNDTCQVLIPDFVLFQYDYTKRLDPDTQRRVHGTMKSMLGSEIDFVVKHWDAKNKTAYGDRLKAMERLGWNYFLNDNNSSRVVKDMIVEATVIAVRQRFLIVNALGVDARIPIEECSWAHYTDLRDHYKNNDAIAAKVLDVSTMDVTKGSNESYTLVGLELSIRKTSKDPREKYWDDYKERGLYIATVTGVDPNGAGVFVLLENKSPALCAYPSFGALPEVGEQKPVEITEKVIIEKNDTNEYRIFGVFKNV